ncbi:MAG: TRAM domain-containing protein [Candidatus Peribacteria bacterium]|jgi:tRNA A37 methylthiotransferase MiaB|nr:TRAM domain-containing protein [Candidatus Peribacteria bacterium]
MLINEKGEDGSFSGYTDNMKQIIISGNADSFRPTVGEMLPVRITGAGEFKLRGEMVI